MFFLQNIWDIALIQLILRKDTKEYKTIITPITNFTLKKNIVRNAIQTCKILNSHLVYM